MCTYNGAAFLKGQLDSFSNQSRLPDEIIICDDGSTDETIEIINGFAVNSKLKVSLFVNAANLGSTKNFEKAISLCSGDIIVLSDQDDIWYPHKLSMLDDKFSREPLSDVVFSNADIVNENLQLLGYTLWDSIGFNSKKQKMLHSGRAFNVLVNTNVVTGATMAFKSDIRDMVLPISPVWIHDGWIALLASTVCVVSIISEPLIQYRQHSSQQIGALRMGLSDRMIASSENKGGSFLERANQFKEAFITLINKGVILNQEQLNVMQGKIHHYILRSRINSLGFSRFMLIAKEFRKGHYSVYSDGLSSIVKDVLGANIISFISAIWKK